MSFLSPKLETQLCRSLYLLLGKLLLMLQNPNFNVPLLLEDPPVPPSGPALPHGAGGVRVWFYLPQLRSVAEVFLSLPSSYLCNVA